MPHCIYRKMCLSIPPKLTVLNIVEFVKGKSVNSITKHINGKKIKLVGFN